MYMYMYIYYTCYMPILYLLCMFMSGLFCCHSDMVMVYFGPRRAVFMMADGRWTCEVELER